MDNFLAYYILAGLTFLIYTWSIVRKNHSLDRIIHFYFIFSPLYMSYIILKYWNVTMVNFIWMAILPLGAFIFFGRKEIIAYTIYPLLLTLALFIIAHSQLIEVEQFKRGPTDIIVIVSIVLTITLVLYYEDKIRSIRIMINIQEDEIEIPISIPESVTGKEIERYDKLFLKIEQAMDENKYFKDPNLNLFNLCSYMDVNSSYVSKAIRYKGYTNFNHYLNFLRIDYSKKLMLDSDFQKVTFMYIYTEAGFRSQSTFNRAFKLIEEITPSEYIRKIAKNK